MLAWNSNGLLLLNLVSFKGLEKALHPMHRCDEQNKKNCLGCFEWLPFSNKKEVGGRG